ncbi:MAG: ABC transporter substrate-binding protein [Ignavibacteriae bacterium]|nr:ABC transporter substrate-binding protein [Ignavibacteriota bacterium]MCB9243010.1 ABC transporter substrate-binding protein [Ignavibacteriales bacterium]
MKSKIIILSVLVLSFFVSSCGDKQEGTFETLNGGVKSGGIFRINETEDIRSLDPVRINDVVSHHVAHQIYDGLIDLDSNLQLVPQLAQTWEISEDGLLYTFHLRKGVYFHDNKCFPDGKGREITAKDVKYSFDRVCDPRTQTIGYSYYKNYVEGAEEYYNHIKEARDNNKEPTMDGVSGYVVKDDSTFQVKLKQPFGPFIYYITLTYGYVVPKEAVDMYGQDYFQNPVGSGPFIFVDWKPDLELNMKRNPNYWMKDEFGNQLPYLEGAKFRFIKDNAAQQLEFTNGSLDESYRIPNETFRDVVGEDGNLTPAFSQYILQKAPTLSIQYYGFLTSGNLFNNKKLRQALNYAIDKEKIVKFVVNGQAFGPAIHGIVPPSMPDYPINDIKGYDYNPTKAKELLTEAGYPGGKGLNVKLQINSGGDRNLQVAEAIQAMLKEVGVNMSLEIIPFAQHLDNIDAGRADMWRLGWVADYPDPENFLNLYWGANVPKDPKQISPLNSTRYINPEFDKLFEQAIKTTDKTERYKLYAQAEQIAVDDAPMMYLYYDQDFRLLQPYVRGYALDPMHRVNFRLLWLDK